MAEALIQAAYASIGASWRERNIQTRDSLARALDGYRVRFSYHSGRIENANITYHDTRSVFEDGRIVGYTGDVRTLFEMQNLKECHESMLDAFGRRMPITEELALSFHRVLTQGTYDEERWKAGERPGEYKHGDYVVGIHDSGCAPSQVSAEMNALFAELEAATRENILTVASYFHLAFESIHPFADGNGRCGRALMNYLLLLYDHPPVVIYNEDKLAYFGAIELWETEGDLEPMKAFLAAETVKTWKRM